ncbi:hypothetical protein [Paraflavitalea pollutisoli]|uniref:hypothetical protein n=1 Tax=Paraflavitalea pollutisoli TaxID=3034143 RepID=UPI0023EA7B8A|nr:hypothetical protein [Paraflavitalea sp. H1-2-19X]
MNYLIKMGRAFYALALIVYGIQQCYFSSFRNVFVSPYQQYLPWLPLWAWLFGGYLIASGLSILTGRRGKEAALLGGAVFLFLFLSTQLTYQLISEPNKIYHLGLWVNQFKELALSGGAFVVAGSFSEGASDNRFYALLNKLVPYGNLLFLFTITVFGMGHIIYAELMPNAVPAWFSDRLFWIYFTGILLVGAGITIGFGIRLRVVALLLSVMIFLWFWIIHVPGAIGDPIARRGEYPASAADALAFSGVALLIAFTMPRQQWVSDIENWGRSLKQPL